MAFTKILHHRLSRISSFTNAACRVSSPGAAAQSKSSNRPAALDPGDGGIFRRFLHRRSAAEASPELKFLPTGEKLLEKLREMGIVRQRIRLDALMPAEEENKSEPPEGNITVKDAVKILKLSQLETVKARLGQIEKDLVSYPEFLEICARDCSNVDQSLEIAKMLDQSGSVIVLGNVVFLRPQQVVQAIRALIPVPTNNSPSMEELREMEKIKSEIDSKARLWVQRELWGGLGCLIVQTAAFMRLTFWELSWDVMEPICFYVTSFYFMGGYAFFLRTSVEPSFEGFYRSRFEAKQKRLMEAENFDVERYNELKRVCFPCSAPVLAKETLGNAVFSSSSFPETH